MKDQKITGWISKRIAILAVALFCTGIGSVASASPLTSETRDNSETPELVANQPTPSVLQVTGTTNNFNISAQHADVQTVLKLVFEQAHRQFVPDASVSGDVTLYLTNQRFDTVLASICTQVVLRYEVDKNGIYQIRRDNQKLLALIQSTHAINRLLAEQLRNMGYDTSAFQNANPTQLRAAQGAAQQNTKSSASAATPPPVSSQNRVRGSVGPEGPQGPAGESGAGVVSDAAKPADKLAGGGFGGGGLSAAAKRMPPAGEKGDTGSTNAPAADNPTSPTRDATLPSAGQGGLSNNSAAGRLERNGIVDLDDPNQYQAFLKQFRMVSINTRGVEVPVRDILQDIGKQAGIGMYIDPSVPIGKDFVMKGSITPRSLSNLLSVLCYNAHLEWQLVNGRIYVTATPEFKLRLNNAPLAPQPPPGK